MDAVDILRKVPLMQINAKSRYGISEPVSFEFDSNTTVLKVDKSGKIYIDNGFLQLDDTTEYVLKIKSQSRETVLDRVIIIVTPMDVFSVQEFCKSFASKLCFWDTATFHIAENNKKFEVIGPLSSEAYRQMCPFAKLNYRLLNNTDYFTIKNGSLTALKSLDHEDGDPGPSVMVSIECSVHWPDKLLGKPHRHTFQVNLVDQNDNGPTLQDEKRYELKLDHQSFRKVGTKNHILFFSTVWP